MTVGGDDWFEVVPLPAFLLAVAVVCSHCCRSCYFLCLILDSLFDVRAIHHGKGSGGGREGPSSG